MKNSETEAMLLRRAYMRGSVAAMKNGDLVPAGMLALMGCGVLCWTALMFFVFRS